MKCSDVTPLLSLYIDKQLDAQQMKQIKEHLHSCENCNVEYHALIDLLADISEIPQLELPEHFSRNLHLRLEQEASKMKSAKESSTTVNFRTVFDKFNEHKRAVLSIGVVAACTLIIFNTGIFDNITPRNHVGTTQSEITQNSPDPKVTAKPPVEGDANIALQATPNPTSQRNTAKTPQSPSQSKITEDSAQIPAQAEPGQQTPDKTSSVQPDVTEAPTPTSSAGNEISESSAATFNIAATNEDASSSGRTTGGASDNATNSAPPNVAPKAAMFSMRVSENTMYVTTKDSGSVILALGDLKQRITQENERSVIKLTEEEFNSVKEKINAMGGNLDISYGFESNDDTSYSYKLVIIGE